jgi:hypothetical protein
MPVIIAAKELRYAGKTFHADESFEATEKDAKLLVQIRKARVSEAAAPVAANFPREVMRRAPIKEITAIAEEEPVERVKRQYRRRDMSAEQD